MNFFDFGLMNSILDGKSFFEYSVRGEKYNVFGWFGLRNMLKFLKLLVTSETYILEIDDEPIGFACFEGNFLNGLYIKKKFRGKGFGKMLLKTAEWNVHNELNINDFRLETEKDTINFYRKLGYEVVEQKGSDYTMRKHL